jgi:hypothetical protein
MAKCCKDVQKPKRFYKLNASFFPSGFESREKQRVELTWGNRVGHPVPGSSRMCFPQHGQGQHREGLTVAHRCKACPHTHHLRYTARGRRSKVSRGSKFWVRTFWVFSLLIKTLISHFIQNHLRNTWDLSRVCTRATLTAVPFQCFGSGASTFAFTQCNWV